MVLIWAACATLESGDSAPPPGFGVVTVTPEDGAVDVVEAVVPQLRLEEGVDLATCAAGTFRLVGLGVDHVVAFDLPLVVSAEEEGERLALDPSGPVPRGWSYGVSVRGGGCTSLQGARLEPFYSSFTVP